jgi:hypothetical protein
MLDLYAELRRIVDALEAAGIRYALAGGLAVSIYASPRATEDIDLLIAREDLEQACATIEALGFRAAGRPMRVAGGRLEIQRLIRIAGTDLLPVDLLIPTDAELAALIGDRQTLEAEGRPLTLVSLRALRALKRLRGSPQDLADLDALGPEA